MQKTNTANIAVRRVFDEREKFAIVGLTGRTGAGCSTAASLLAKSFDELRAPFPRNLEHTTNDDRQYLIAYKFLQANWHKFYVIRAADIISSFVLEQDFGAFLAEYSALIGGSASDLKDELTSEFQQLYDLRHSERLNIQRRVGKDETALKEPAIHQFNYADLPSFTLSVKDALETIRQGSYIKFYQHVANNIRRSGNAYSSVFVPEAIFRLAQRVNSFIKQLRRRQKESQERVLVCIDAIRNPFEASFFRERYAAFYLMAISTDEPERRRRLRSLPLGLDEATIDQIDKKESPPKLGDEEFYYSQNIQKCVEMADIHIYNPHDESNTWRDMKQQLVKYVALINHPGLVQPTDVERCMQLAIVAKLNSGCISRQVGAVITDGSYSVKAIGWNSAPEGQVPCSLRNVDNLLNAEDSLAFSDFELTNEAFKATILSVYDTSRSCKNGVAWPMSYCFKDIKNCIDEEKNQVYTRALHGEENAFLQITKYGGQGIENGYLFTTSSPCELCAKKAYQLGIRKVYYLDPYPGISGSHVLAAGTARPKIVPFVGAVGRGYQQLFEPIMPHKEAMRSLLNLELPNIKSDLRKRIKDLEHQCDTLSRENEALKAQSKIKQSKTK